MKIQKVEKQRMVNRAKMVAKNIVKPFIRHIQSIHGIDHNVIDLMGEFGLTAYSDPDDSQYFFISNIPLTYRWLLENCSRYPFNEHWEKARKPSKWLTDMVEAGYLDEELDTIY